MEFPEHRKGISGEGKHAFAENPGKLSVSNGQVCAGRPNEGNFKTVFVTFFQKDGRGVEPNGMQPMFASEIVYPRAGPAAHVEDLTAVRQVADGHGPIRESEARRLDGLSGHSTKSHLFVKRKI